MVSRLGHYVNRAVLISIPPIFSDPRPRDCRVIDLEPTGLWLESADLWRIAFPDAEKPPSAVFVPFTHIAYLVEAPPASQAPATRPRNAPPPRVDPPRGRRPRAQAAASKKRG